MSRLAVAGQSPLWVQLGGTKLFQPEFCDGCKEEETKRTKRDTSPLPNPNPLKGPRVPVAVAWLKPWPGARLYQQGAWPPVSAPRGCFNVPVVPEISGEVFYRSFLWL